MNVYSFLIGISLVCNNFVGVIQDKKYGKKVVDKTGKKSALNIICPQKNSKKREKTLALKLSPLYYTISIVACVKLLAAKTSKTKFFVDQKPR